MKSTITKTLFITAFIGVTATSVNAQCTAHFTAAQEYGIFNTPSTMEHTGN